MNIGTAVAHPHYAAIRWRRHLFYTGLPIAMALAVMIAGTDTWLAFARWFIS
jgi:hypothetical protein